MGVLSGLQTQVGVGSGRPGAGLSDRERERKADQVAIFSPTLGFLTDWGCRQERTVSVKGRLCLRCSVSNGRARPGAVGAYEWVETGRTFTDFFSTLHREDPTKDPPSPTLFTPVFYGERVEGSLESCDSFTVTVMYHCGYHPGWTGIYYTEKYSVLKFLFMSYVCE